MILATFNIDLDLCLKKGNNYAFTFQRYTTIANLMIIPSVPIPDSLKRRWVIKSVTAKLMGVVAKLLVRLLATAALRLRHYEEWPHALARKKT
jgi:hypothetical protein